MINVQTWMRDAVDLLQKEFGDRLLFVGLQGSYRRGEAGEDSDIDILTILDRLDVADLEAYRKLLRRLPEGKKAGGFTCGREELAAWPPLELFQFARDTEAWHGKLEPLLPPVSRADTVAGARVAVSGLYHGAAYLYLSGDEAGRGAELKGLFKSFFFAMQLVEYLRSGVYAQSKKELLPRLGPDEAELFLSLDPARCEEQEKKDPAALFHLLLAWARQVMVELADQSAAG